MNEQRRRALLEPWLQYVTILTWAFWMGGFSFYFGVVIRVGSEVIGDTQQGFVTQGVTLWLNRISILALAWFLVDAGMQRRRSLALACIPLAVTQAFLFWYHAKLDAVLSATSMTITDAEAFPSLHEAYEFTAAIQWLCAMIYLGLYVWITSSQVVPKPVQSTVP